MDREAVIIIAAKDIFIEKFREKTLNIPGHIAEDKELLYLADKFIEFTQKLQSALK